MSLEHEVYKHIILNYSSSELAESISVPNEEIKATPLHFVATNFADAMISLHRQLTASLPTLSENISTLQIMLIFALICWLFSSKNNENLLLRNFLRKINWYLSGIIFMVTFFVINFVSSKLIFLNIGSIERFEEDWR